MGRFTHLDDPTLGALLARFGVTPAAAAPVDAGSVNTYVRVDDRSRTYYLRVDERADPAAVRDEVALLARIHDPRVPRVVPTLDGEAFTRHGEKPVLLFEEVVGRSVPWAELAPAHLTTLGRAVAALHRVDASGLAPHRFHPQALYEAHYLPMRAQILAARPDIGAALEAVFHAGWAPFTLPSLPRAIVHADLFVDNLHFDGDTCGLLDFEAAGEGPRALDLAIALHALCFDPAADAFVLPRVDALLDAWRAVHPPTADERAAWPALLAYGAARFLFTRVRDFDLGPGAAAQPVRKNPRDFLKALRASPDLARRRPL
ncbi:MAG: homoserine kinase [Polyangiales bacterium]